MTFLHQASRTALLVGAALVGWQTAHAQGPAAPPATTPADAGAATDVGDPTSLQTTRTTAGEIIVTAHHYVPDSAKTASKSNIPLIEMPQSISVITRDQIDLLNFIDAQQAVRYTAGVFGENYGPDPRYDFVTVRGFTPREYIDGLAVPATTTISSTGLDLYAFQTLDILKGPSSALYGLAPPGGIVNETSRRPSDTFGGEVEAKGGTNNFVEAAGTVTGPVNPMIDLRLTGLYRDADGQIDYQHIKRAMVAPAATIKFDPETKLTVLGYYQFDDVRGGAGGFLPIEGTLLPNPNGMLSPQTNLDDPNDEFIRRQYGVGYDFEHTFAPGIVFTSNTKWSHYKEATDPGIYSTSSYSGELSGFVVEDAANPSDPANFATLNRSNFTYVETVRSFATDNRLDATFETGPVRHKALVGLDYRNVSNVAAFGFTGVGTINVYAPAYPSSATVDIGYPYAYNNENLKQTGVYAQDQLKFGQLFVLLGGRYDWVKGNDATSSISNDKQHKFTYRIGANYVTDAGIAPYVSYATSFEPLLGVDSTTNAPLKPTQTHQWEGGAKYDGKDLGPGIKIFGTVAAFDIRESNFTSPQSSITPIFVTQGGEVDVYGFETEVVARFHEQLSFNFAYSYNHSKVLSAVSEPLDVGDPLPTTPRNKVAGFVDYTLQKGALGGLGFGAGVRYNSSSTGALPGPYETPVIYAGAVTLVDAIIHYDMPHWRFAVNASNLFDKIYVARCASDNGCVYGAGRQVIGTATYKF
jgi:iron complex outermembrane receptor protein